MSEKISSPTVNPETKPTVVDPETVAEINGIDMEKDERVPSRFAERIRVTVERVTTFLDRRAINKAHGEALQEDFRRNLASEEEPSLSPESMEDVEDNEPKLDSDEVEESDEEEVAPDTTEIKDVEAEIEAETNAETKEKKRKSRTVAALKKVGFFAIEKLEANGFVPPMRVWQEGDGVRARIANAYVARHHKEERIDKSSGAGGSEGVPTPPAEAKKDAADKEALPSEPEVDPAVEKARERAAENGRKAAERKANRKERTPLRERASSLWQRLMSRRRKIGTKALAFATRIRASAGAAGEAWKNFDQ